MDNDSLLRLDKQNEWNERNKESSISITRNVYARTMFPQYIQLLCRYTTEFRYERESAGSAE